VTFFVCFVVSLVFVGKTLRRRPICYLVKVYVLISNRPIDVLMIALILVLQYIGIFRRFATSP
jgi:hypothetical protein